MTLVARLQTTVLIVVLVAPSTQSKEEVLESSTVAALIGSLSFMTILFALVLSAIGGTPYVIMLSIWLPTRISWYVLTNYILLTSKYKGGERIRSGGSNIFQKCIDERVQIRVGLKKLQSSFFSKN